MALSGIPQIKPMLDMLWSDNQMSVLTLVKAPLIHRWSRVNSRKVQRAWKEKQPSVPFVCLTKSFTSVLRQFFPCLSFHNGGKSQKLSGTASTSTVPNPAVPWHSSVKHRLSAGASSELSPDPALSRRLSWRPPASPLIGRILWFRDTRDEFSFMEMAPDQEWSKGSEPASH